MPHAQFTPCTPADLHTLQDIAINSYGDHYLYLWYDGGMWYIDRSFKDEALKAELADPNAAFYLIHAEEELVGFLKLNLHKAFAEYPAAEALELERIYLTKAASGKGIGAEAVKLTKAIAAEHGKKVIWLKAMDSSRSVDFYEKNGFEKCGTHRLDFEQMKPEYRGMYVMKMEL
ncbi:GNAT family N-acetyltransferase [Pontibacter akesuensis]|uniref:Spermine/spermidine N-acetyltransferase n=1 Tax=Pontibacter akesuensis TaxID=388950 RepID=A0A1I7H223_9BACT|nr:GNAT family N-acetyltransferase [Pontibacter akesuensis]GHA53891.1 N-acetyltransferase [Pontibacter akesuensis]SFU54755.1 spermine/spermidine N-acetyltransferase [Pontibacter akesuensis]